MKMFAKMVRELTAPVTAVTGTQPTLDLVSALVSGTSNSSLLLQPVALVAEVPSFPLNRQVQITAKLLWFHLILSMVDTLTTTQPKFFLNTWQPLRTQFMLVVKYQDSNKWAGTLRCSQLLLPLMDIDTCSLMSSSQIKTTSKLEFRYTLANGQSLASSTDGQKEGATGVRSKKMEAREASIVTFWSTRTTQYWSDPIPIPIPVMMKL